MQIISFNSTVFDKQKKGLSLHWSNVAHVTGVSREVVQVNLYQRIPLTKISLKDVTL